MPVLMPMIIMITMPMMMMPMTPTAARFAHQGRAA
jgi:hypothetical protein